MFRRRSSSDLHLVQLGSSGDSHGSFDPVVANRLSEVESAIFDASLSKLSSSSSMSRTDSRDISTAGLQQQYSLQSSMLGHQSSPLLLAHQHDPLPALLFKRGSSTFSQVGNQAEQQQMLQHQMLLHRRSSSTDTIASAVCSALKGRLSLELSSSGPSISETISSVVHAAASGCAPESMKFGRRRVGSADYSPVESESPQLFVEPSPYDMEADVGSLSPARTSWERLTYFGSTGRIHFPQGEGLPRSCEFGGRDQTICSGESSQDSLQEVPVAPEISSEQSISSVEQNLSQSHGSHVPHLASTFCNCSSSGKSRPYRDTRLYEDVWCTVGAKLEPRGEVGFNLQQVCGHPKLGTQALQAVSFDYSEASETWNGDDPERRGSIQFQMPSQMSVEDAGHQACSPEAVSGSAGNPLLTNEQEQQKQHIVPSSFSKQSAGQALTSGPAAPDHVEKAEGVYEQVHWSSEDYGGLLKPRRSGVCRGFGSQWCETPKEGRGAEQFEKEILIKGNRLLQMQLRPEGGDASGSVKCPAAENTSNLSEKQYKGFPGSSTMHYSGFPQMTAGHEESANYGAASFLHSKGMLSASTPSVEWKSGPTGNSSSPFEASGDELLPDRGSPLRSLDFSGGCQRRQVPELTRGVKCVRGAARATVQQLYGQMYDLEALAVELDRANIDDLDPGDFDRSYHHGKRFAVGDLGRKLLLIVVREKLEAGACGQLKFLTLTDLFRLAHELGLWEFALKVAMAYKAGGLRIPKANTGPHVFGMSQSPRSGTDYRWGSAASGVETRSPQQVCCGSVTDSEMRGVRRTRKSRRRSPLSMLKAEDYDVGNIHTPVKGEQKDMPSDMQQD